MINIIISFVLLFSSTPKTVDLKNEIIDIDFKEEIKIPDWEHDDKVYLDIVNTKRVMVLENGGTASTKIEVIKPMGVITVNVVKLGDKEAKLLLVGSKGSLEYDLKDGKNDITYDSTSLDVDKIKIENNSGNQLIIEDIISSDENHLINNSNFMKSLEIPNWTIASEDFIVKEGILELHDNDTTKTTTIRSEKIEISAGDEYELKVDMEILKQSHSVEIGVSYFKEDGTQLPNYNNVLVRNKANTGRFIQTLELPKVEGAKYISIAFNSGAISITEAKFYGLQVALVEEQKAGDEIYETLQNPNFEDGLDHWKVIAENEPFKVVDSISSSGMKSLYMQDLVSEGTNATARILSNKVRVDAGSTYLATAKVNVETQSHSIVFVKEYYDENDKVLKVHEELFSSPTLGTNKWTTIRKMSEAPLNASYVRVGFYSGTPSITKAYFDDVTFEKINSDESLERDYESSIDLGSMVDVGLGQAGAIGINAQGENEVYFVSNGSPGTFYALDGNTGEVKYSEVIPNTIAVWAITIGKDKNVYFGGTEDGKLYRYLPLTKKIEDLGSNPADKWIWDLEVADSGKIYGTTYPNAKLFEYDPETHQFKDLGQAHKTQQYARGLGIDGNDIYIGIGTNSKHLIKYSMSENTMTELQIDGYSGTVGTFEDVKIIGDYLFISNGSINMLVVDKNTLEVKANFQYSNNISLPTTFDSQHIYFKFEEKFFSFNLETLEKKEIMLNHDLPDTVRTKDLQWIEVNGERKLALLTQYAEYMLVDPKAKTVSFIPLDVSLQSVDIQSLELGFDGRLYMGGYQRGMSVYNPFTDEIDVNLPTFAQPEGIGFLNNKVYYGTYVGAIMYSYDPNKEISLTNNPNYEYKISDQQDRPFAIESGDNKLFVGTIPDYGVLGGVLAVYDEETKTWSQHRNIVEDQSIISLAYKDGYIYGGTSVWGGLGIEPSQSEAKMFIWDVVNERLVKSFTLDIPGIDEVPRMIGNLKFGPDGLLWGVVDGTIFAYDIATDEIVKSKMIQPSLYNSSKWFPYRIHFAPDGMMYTTISRKLVAIDPETLDHKIIVDQFINNMTVGVDGSIFYALKDTLYKIEVPETDATLKDITIGGQTLDKFSNGILEYETELALGDVVATPNQSETAVEVELDKDKVTITTLAADGISSLTYTINGIEKENPEEPINPTNPIEPTDSSETDNNENSKGSEMSETPKTGINTSSIGYVLVLVFGVSIMIVSKKRRQE